MKRINKWSISWFNNNNKNCENTAEEERKRWMEGEEEGKRWGEEGKLECARQSLHTEFHALLYVIQNHLPKHILFSCLLYRWGARSLQRLVNLPPPPPQFLCSWVWELKTAWSCFSVRKWCRLCVLCQADPHSPSHGMGSISLQWNHFSANN